MKRIEEFMEQGGRTVAKSKAIAEELTEQGCRAMLRVREKSSKNKGAEMLLRVREKKSSGNKGAEQLLRVRREKTS